MCNDDKNSKPQILKCAVLDDYQNMANKFADWSRLAPHINIQNFTNHIANEAHLVEELKDFDVIVVMRERTRFTKFMFDHLPRLKLLVTTGMVNASIDLDAAHKNSVVVSGTPGSVGPAAELAWGLLLAIMRNIPQETQNFRNGGSAWQLSVGSDLQYKTLGVIGLGNLGQRVVEYAKAFKMNVVGWSKNSTPERCAALGVEYCETLDDLLRQSDAISLHITLNSQTNGIISEREINMMKPGAMIVNTSRGPLIQEDALISALQSGHLGGAALDVFDKEPLPQNHIFRDLPNVIATPHIGYVTKETYQIYYQGAVESIEAWFSGNPCRILTL